MMVDDADRLLGVPPSRRQTVLNRIDEWDRVPGLTLALALIGSPALASAVSEYRTTQMIHLDAMAADDSFTTAARMIFGVTDPAAVAALHEASGGLMGRLVHLARMRGLGHQLISSQPDA